MAAQELYRNYCDLVCEGGGVKGIGLAGAFSVLEEHDFRPQNVAGTSAGAITAALIAAGYTAAELKDVIFGMDFLKFRDTAWEDIGYQGASGLVRHVDVRHVGPNTTKSSVRDPAIWIY